MDTGLIFTSGGGVGADDEFGEEVEDALPVRTESIEGGVVEEAGGVIESIDDVNGGEEGGVGGGAGGGVVGAEPDCGGEAGGCGDFAEGERAEGGEDGGYLGGGWGRECGGLNGAVSGNRWKGGKGVMAVEKEWTRVAEKEERGQESGFD